MKPIRVLYVNGGIMSLGGISSYMMNYYRNIDRNKIQIDFVVHGFEKGVYDEEIKNMGGNIYNIPIKSENYIGNINALKKIFVTGEYKIVHSHMDAMGIIPLKLAKKYNIPIRIAHSHNTQHLTNNKIKIFLNEIARKNICRYATHMFACSQKAGIWLFGQDMLYNNKIRIIYNSIDFDKFKYNPQKKYELRNVMNIENDFVIGHIGRFDYQKNHNFIIELFVELLKFIPNAKLVLVGEGHLKDDIEKKIIELGISKNVFILGARKDIHNIYNLFDIFILPSLFEGLPVVGVEAQLNGLTCIFSNNITDEVKITENVFFKPLNIKEWVDIICKLYNFIDKNDRLNLKYINNRYENYDIKKTAKEIEQLYLKLYSEYCDRKDKNS